MEHGAARRCMWTGTVSDRVVAVEVPDVDRFGRHRGTTTLHVLPEHEAALRGFVDRVHRFGAPFLVGVVVLGGLAFAAAIAPAFVPAWEWLVRVSGVLLVGMGVLFFALPFGTPETVAFLGVRRTVAVVRFLAGVLVAMGLLIALAG